MILSFTIFNTSGKPRLVKFYESKTEAEQQQIIRECFSHISKRTAHMCNFMEGGKWCGGGKYYLKKENDFCEGPGSKVIYRVYATLYFVLVVDQSESELGILDLIQTFVEALDKSFKNVCELDLVFHHDKVLFLVEEILTGGLVLETKTTDIMDAIIAQNKIEKQENPLSDVTKFLDGVMK